MASVILAGTTSTTALNLTGDTSGELQLKTNNGSTTALTLTTGGNINIPTAGARITGDMSNATIPNRLAFQTSGTNLSTVVTVIPNGSGTAASLNLESDSALTTGHVLSLSALTGETRLNSAIRGAGSYVPLTMYTGGSERLRIDTSGNLGIGTTSPSLGLTVVKDNGSGYVASFRANTGSPALTIQTTGGITQIQGINSAFTDVANIAFQPSGGNVGIGTAVPAQRLHVSTASGNSFLQISSGSNNIYYGWENSRSVASVQSNTAITFDTGGSYTERMRIDSSGNVGIGTSSPSGSDWNASATVVQVSKNDTNGGLFKATSSNTNFILSAGNNLAYIATTTNTPITFYTNTTERMRITSGGNVAIATSSSQSGLEIYRANSTTGSLTDASLMLSTTATTGRKVNIGFGLGAGVANTCAAVIGYDVTNGSGAGLGDLFFSTRNTTADSTPTERMRITSAGDVIVAKTTTADATVGATMQNSGRIAGTMAASTNAVDTMTVYSTGAGLYRFYLGMGGTIYATSTTITGISDQRLKENIVDLPDGLDAVMALKPRKFDWKEGKGKNIKGDRGFIAQEFETVFPDMIETWKDPAPKGEEPYKGVNPNLIPTLVKAIQEQQAIITDLKQRIETLEAK